MTAFFVAGTALLASMILPLALIVRGRLVDAVIGLELVGVTVTLLLLLLAAGDADASLADPAVVLAFLTFGGSLVYLHYVEERV